jgi:hypothetical protein
MVRKRHVAVEVSRLRILERTTWEKFIVFLPGNGWEFPRVELLS